MPRPSSAQTALVDLGTIGGYPGTFTYVKISPYDSLSIGIDRTDSATNGSQAFAISADGSAVVGAAGSASGYAHAFVWTAAGGMVDLGSLASNQPSVALATSSNSSVVVGVGLNSGGLVHAFEWTAKSGMVDLASQLNGAAGESEAAGVSGDGSVVVGTLNPVAAKTSAFRWTAAGGMTTLGTLNSGGLTTSATGISADGSTTVGWGLVQTGGGAFGHSILWHADGIANDLGAIGGITGNSQATAVNANGTVVVGESEYATGATATTTTTQLHAYRWTSAGGMVDLGTIGGATGLSQALAVNASGSVVVGWSAANDPTLAGHAFMWTAQSGMQDLNSVLTKAGVDLTGITLISAHGVSANGDFVTGDETLAALGPNTTHAFIARVGNAGGSGGGGGSLGVTTPDSLINSIQGLANSMTAQMLNQALFANVLLGLNEQLSCSDCGGASVSFGSFTIGSHGRRDLNDEWTLLGGASYGRYREEGANVTSSWTVASSLRFDPAGMGTSRPFAEIGVTAAPDQHVTYSRSYANGSATTTAMGDTSSGNYAAFGRVGWIGRVTRVDEVGAYVQFTREWQTVKAYTEVSAANPFGAAVPSGSNSQSVIGVGAQYTHLFGRYTEVDINAGVAHAAGVQSSIDASVAGYGNIRLTPPHLTWETVGGRIGRRVGKRVTLDLFADAVLGPRQIGTSVHGGFDFNIKF
jgi:probable HAF family extracellular repeat protein